MRPTQNRKKSINSLLKYGHGAQKIDFVVFTASRFQYVLLYPNLMVVLREGTAYLKQAQLHITFRA